MQRPGADSGRDGDVGEGGMMLAGTGIAEVALPTEEKLRNIEETERLRQQMLERRAARAAEMADDGGLPHARYTSGSITANYTMHRREFAMNMKVCASAVRGVLTAILVRKHVERLACAMCACAGRGALQPVATAQRECAAGWRCVRTR
ncbi:hypothetical protein EON67_03045 [archaeon]|nr:MAG: hypothetical protein EON67_03045 [archaeon]